MPLKPLDAMNVSQSIVDNVVNKAKKLSFTLDQNYLHSYFNINTGDVVFKVGTEDAMFTVTIYTLCEFNFSAFEYLYHKVDQALLRSNIQVVSYRLINRDEDEFGA